MAYQTTDPNILDTIPGYDVYGFPTGAEELAEETCQSIDNPLDPSMASLASADGWAASATPYPITPISDGG